MNSRSRTRLGTQPLGDAGEVEIRLLGDDGRHRTTICGIGSKDDPAGPGMRKLHPIFRVGEKRQLMGIRILQRCQAVDTGTTDTDESAAKTGDNLVERGLHGRQRGYLVPSPRDLITLSVMSIFGLAYTTSWTMRSNFSASATCLMTLLTRS